MWEASLVLKLKLTPEDQSKHKNSLGSLKKSTYDEKLELIQQFNIIPINPRSLNSHSQTDSKNLATVAFVAAIVT
jgi:hypothetical protein